MSDERDSIDKSDLQAKWREAFPDPKPSNYSRLGVRVGMAMGALLLGGVNLWIVGEFADNRYGDLNPPGHYNPRAGHALGLILLVACSPGLVVGGAIGAFIGGKIGPKD